MIEDKPFLEVLKEEVEASKDVAHMLHSMYVRTGNPEYQYGLVQLAKDNLLRTQQLLGIKLLEDLYCENLPKQSKPPTETTEGTEQERKAAFFESIKKLSLRNRHAEDRRCSYCGGTEGDSCTC